MLEKKIEEHLVKRIKEKGGIAYKFTSPQRRSVPDRLVLMPGSKAGLALMKVLLSYGVPLSLVNKIKVDAQALDIVAEGVCFVELKATGQKPTVLQLREHEFLRKLGSKVLVIDSKEEIDERWPK